MESVKMISKGLNKPQNDIEVISQSCVPEAAWHAQDCHIRFQLRELITLPILYKNLKYLPNS